MQFEWDGDKAEANYRKHGVDFDEASTVFGDSFARIFEDDEHSFDERRTTNDEMVSLGILQMRGF